MRKVVRFPVRNAVYIHYNYVVAKLKIILRYNRNQGRWKERKGEMVLENFEMHLYVFTSESWDA